MTSAYDTGRLPLLSDLPASQIPDVLDSLPDATLVINDNGLIVFASQQVEPVFGYKPNELIGKPVETLVPVSARPAHVQHREGYFAKPKFREMGGGLTLKAQRKDGSVFPAEICLGYIQNDQGSLVISSIRDVSERKKTEQLEINDWRFKLLLQHTPLAIALVDRQMNYLDVSERWLQDYHLQDRDIIGLNFYDVFPEVSDDWKELHQRCLNGEVIQVNEDIFTRADGTTDWLNWQCRPWHEANGEIGGIAIFSDLVTRRKRAEMALGKSEEHLRKIYENAMTGITISNMAGYFQHCNAAFCGLLGYSLDELRQLKFTDVIHPDDVETNLAEVARLHTENLPYVDITNRYLKKNGDPIWVRKIITLLDDETGQPNQYLSIINDNSKLKEAEEILLSSRHNLENLVYARTQELEVAKQHAEDASDFKTRFLTAASHDLRQPLQSAGLYLSVLSQVNDSPQQQVICEAMTQSLDVMSNLLDALLDISRFESGSVVPIKKDFSLDRLLSRIVLDNFPQADAKGLKLIYPNKHYTVHSDPTLLERIIENFIANAIRYTKKGQVTVACDCTDGFVSIAVSDTGVGIPQNELDKIFGEYYQLGNPGRDRRKGLGLGLAIAKHISHILEHPISVQSMLGYGSVFTIKVPLGDDNKRAKGAPYLVASEAGHRVKPEVMFVEDDPMIIKAMTVLFETVGIQAYTADTGEAAIAKVKAGARPDVIVSDYRLPGCNGIEVIKQIRAIVQDTIPAIIISGDTSLRQIENEDLPKCNVFRKPVNAKKLVATIFEVTKVLVE